MKIVLLGTGTPNPESNRFGSAILIEAGGEKLLFDCGRGAVIRLSEAGVNVNEIDRVFLTHLHSDHIVGLPDLWLTGWLLGRRTALQVWGPTGTSGLTKHLAEAFHFDVEMRESTQQLPGGGAEIRSQEIQQGDIYNEGNIKVTAFVVDHGPVKPAFGYRVDYSGHSAVISGDTRFSENLIHFAKGTDCLIHSAWSISSKNPTPPASRRIASAEDAAQVFSMTQPRLAVVYHYQDPFGMEDAIRASYKGRFVIGKDLMTIHVGHKVTWEER
jgi:ribonuclease Z